MNRCVHLENGTAVKYLFDILTKACDSLKKKKEYSFKVM